VDGLKKPSIDKDVDMYAAALRSLQKISGLPSQEVVRIIGREFGAMISDKIASDQVPEVLGRLNAMLEGEELGHSEVRSWSPIVLLVTGCIGCERDPDYAGGRVTCPLREGIIEAVLQKKTGRKVSVQGRVVGKGVGTKTCEFEIRV
jgi:predicted hydrocarbon binding protein